MKSNGRKPRTGQQANEESGGHNSLAPQRLNGGRRGSSNAPLSSVNRKHVVHPPGAEIRAISMTPSVKGHWPN
jgi:hypothetical protein